MSISDYCWYLYVVSDVDVEEVKEAPSLEILNLTNNPISPRCHDMLSSVTSIEISLTPREKEDWEDLTI